jgi:hypothetical protein
MCLISCSRRAWPASQAKASQWPWLGWLYTTAQDRLFDCIGRNQAGPDVAWAWLKK